MQEKVGEGDADEDEPLGPVIENLNPDPPSDNEDEPDDDEDGVMSEMVTLEELAREDGVGAYWSSSHAARDAFEGCMAYYLH